MYLLDATFDELRQRLQSPDALHPTKSDPMFYFVLNFCNLPKHCEVRFRREQL
jgi:hypothetical protein